jgi:hypothetical protein
MFMMAHGVLHGRYKKWWPLFFVSNDPVSYSYDHEISIRRGDMTMFPFLLSFLSGHREFLIDRGDSMI